MNCDLKNLDNLIDDEVNRTKERVQKLSTCFEEVETNKVLEICPSIELQEQIDDLLNYIRVKIAIYNDDKQTKERIKASLREAAEEILKRAE